MPEEEFQGLGIIFHSGTYDKVFHGLSFAISGLVMDMKVKLFFTYWSLRYLKKGNEKLVMLDSEGENNKKFIDKNRAEGHMYDISEYIDKIKTLEGEVFVCSASMAMYKVKQEDLIDSVDKVAGIATFLAETQGYQLLYI
jgi:peroxiredoxin family protein